MTMENLMKALMESATSSRQQAGSGQAAGGDMLSQVLGGLMSGGQQQSAPQQAAGGGDMMSQILGGLMGGGQQQSMPQQSGGGDMMSQVLGGLMGGGQQQAMPQQSAGGAGNVLLGALESIIGGQPGSGQLGLNQGNAMNMNANSPIMAMLQPVVSQLAAKANIPPQIATVVASIAVHYLLSSHPSTSPRAPMDLGNVMQQLSTGNVSHDVLNNSGMVNDVMQATGLNRQQAVKSLDTTFQTLGAHVHGTANLRRSTG